MRWHAREFCATALSAPREARRAMVARRACGVRKKSARACATSITRTQRSAKRRRANVYDAAACAQRGGRQRERAQRAPYAESAQAANSAGGCHAITISSISSSSITLIALRLLRFFFTLFHCRHHLICERRREKRKRRGRGLFAFTAFPGAAGGYSRHAIRESDINSVFPAAPPPCLILPVFAATLPPSTEKIASYAIRHCLIYVYR